MPDATLLPPSATDFERALVRAAARATDIPVPIRRLWSVDDCPLELLPWLAWALCLRTWKDGWPERVKRARIRSAIPTHRRLGTARAVRGVVESFGASIAFREWFEMQPFGDPHSFTVILSIGDGLPQSAEFQSDIIAEIELTKPERSQYSLVAGLTAGGGIDFAAAANPVLYRSLSLESTPQRDIGGAVALVAAANPIIYQPITLMGARPERSLPAPLLLADAEPLLLSDGGPLNTIVVN